MKYMIPFLALFLAACSTGQNYANRMVSISDLGDRPVRMVSEYRIGIGDVMNINVWKNPDLGVTVPVRPDGKISAPLVGDIVVAGLTPEEVAEEITRRLASTRCSQPVDPTNSPIPRTRSCSAASMAIR